MFCFPFLWLGRDWDCARLSDGVRGVCSLGFHFGLRGFCSLGLLFASRFFREGCCWEYERQAPLLPCGGNGGGLGNRRAAFQKAVNVTAKDAHKLAGWLTSA